jgi:hypothetical protein
LALVCTPGDAAAARLLAADIDNPRLTALIAAGADESGA